jgi:NADPH:quinone reductase
LSVLGFALGSFDAPPALRDDLPNPTVADDGLLVRVRTSAVNGADVAIAAGMLKEIVEHEFPVTLGRDFAGVVEQVGDRVSRHKVGDEVFGFLPHADPTVRKGTWTELIAVPEDNFVAAKPRSLDMAKAGAAPLAPITALAALDALAPLEGATVLVVGAVGGVGSFFVQLAASAGAHVIAPGLSEDVDYVRELGAAEVPDRNADVETMLRDRYSEGVDAVLDLVSYTPDDSLLEEGGRLALSLGVGGEGPGRFNLMAQPTPANLERLAELLEGGALRVPIQNTFELAEAGEALATFSSAHTQGKLGITVG